MKRAAVAIAALGLFSAGALLARPLLDAKPAHAQAGKQEAKAAEVGRFSLVVTAEGNTRFFLDTKTGRMWRQGIGDGDEWEPYPSPVSNTP